VRRIALATRVRAVPGIQADSGHEALDHPPDPVAGRGPWRGGRRKLRFWPKIFRGERRFWKSVLGFLRPVPAPDTLPVCPRLTLPAPLHLLQRTTCSPSPGSERARALASAPSPPLGNRRGELSVTSPCRLHVPCCRGAGVSPLGTIPGSGKETRYFPCCGSPRAACLGDLPWVATAFEMWCDSLPTYTGSHPREIKAPVPYLQGDGEHRVPLCDPSQPRRSLLPLGLSEDPRTAPQADPVQRNRPERRCHLPVPFRHPLRAAVEPVQPPTPLRPRGADVRLSLLPVQPDHDLHLIVRDPIVRHHLSFSSCAGVASPCIGILCFANLLPLSPCPFSPSSRVPACPPHRVPR